MTLVTLMVLKHPGQELSPKLPLCDVSSGRWSRIPQVLPPAPPPANKAYDGHRSHFQWGNFGHLIEMGCAGFLFWF